ncbi:hypothetical protein MFIFM68171_01140 [Madurella fahalii]|uniref:Uncharacterized protein n=1 Tax=Madurella fahalii TaxID=1157608 RepID=A0ABQ0FZI6_9PEZI
MNNAHLVETLTGSFIALSDEVQFLIDRKTILEHKLRYAHEQYQYLADKYAPAASDVSETLAKLQLPPDLQSPIATAISAVPLPKRGRAGSSQHQVALLIREGRRAAQQLRADMDVMTSVSTVLEQDFTVQGKKGVLACPFSAKLNQDGGLPSGAEPVDGPQDPAAVTADPTPHKSADPICAAMFDEARSATVPAASKCPIRFLDQHSPEEIAHYVETHKHEIPRSHEVCVRRYQRNEEQIRKLDAKYGNLVSMVKDLSHLHRPMLPPATEDNKEADRASNKRVEDWAQTVVAGDPEREDQPPVEEERESRFDRPLRDVRLGESPSRPWGISVPPTAGVEPDTTQLRGSSPPRPAQMPIPPQPVPKESKAARKCPFDHTRMAPKDAIKRETGHDADAQVKRPVTPAKNNVPPSSPPQPTFINLPETLAPSGEKGERPQVVVNISGPVFIGYPMEQAIQFMQRFQGH